MPAAASALSRAAYFVRNAARDALPQAIFRRRLDSVLEGLSLYDETYIRDRVNYCNRLDETVALPPEACPVRRIPKARSLYYYDLKQHARYFPEEMKLCHFFGDRRVAAEVPSFAKSRPVSGDNRNSVLLNLNKLRHFYFPRDTLPFDDKKPSAVWRGADHTQMRRRLLSMFAGHPFIDVASHRRDRQSFLCPRGQMAYKYIISLEGMDVASNLKWIMASNSLCFTQRPTCETWFMEGRLKAGVHYVEIADDLSDLEDKVLHYEKHPDEAKAIVRNANAYLRPFMDARLEQIVSLLVVFKYFAMTGQIVDREAPIRLAEPDTRLAPLSLGPAR